MGRRQCTVIINKNLNDELFNSINKTGLKFKIIKENVTNEEANEALDYSREDFNSDTKLIAATGNYTFLLGHDESLSKFRALWIHISKEIDCEVAVGGVADVVGGGYYTIYKSGFKIRDFQFCDGEIYEDFGESLLIERQTKQQKGHNYIDPIDDILANYGYDALFKDKVNFSIVEIGLENHTRMNTRTH